MSPAYNTTREDLAALLARLEIPVERVNLVDAADPSQDLPAPKGGPGHVLVAQIGYSPDVAAAIHTYRRRSDSLLATDGAALFFLKGRRTAAELARWRNALWPWLHLVAICELSESGVRLRTFHSREELALHVSRHGHLLVARRREHVLSPEATVEKFGRNAGGWNMQPETPGYAHFRWMRRFVGRFAAAPAGARILDFGCGAGWVGIEAALQVKQGTLCMFDPSPELARSAEENARRAGCANVEVRTGFGEEPPFPARGEEPFDLVLSSGVVSFAPDTRRWVDGLCSTVKPGGILVVGDNHRESRGMRRRRRRKPLLPAREMNALARVEMLELLKARGFAPLRSAGYQLTWPVPEAMHLSDTRMRGLLSPPILWLNQASAALGRAAGGPLQAQFDSWVASARAPA